MGSGLLPSKGRKRGGLRRQKGGRKALIEVSLSSDPEHVEKIRRAVQETGIREAYIITLEGEKRELGDGLEVPLFDWFLSVAEPH
jgi:hypothetical protein